MTAPGLVERAAWLVRGAEAGDQIPMTVADPKVATSDAERAELVDLARGMLRGVGLDCEQIGTSRYWRVTAKRQQLDLWGSR